MSEELLKVLFSNAEAISTEPKEEPMEVDAPKAVGSTTAESKVKKGSNNTYI